MRVSLIESVTSFAEDPAIVLSTGAVLKELSKELKAQLLMVNVPDGAPPELPRLVLRMQETLINVAHNRFQFTMVPPDHVNGDFASSIRFVRNRVSPIIERLMSSGSGYSWTGVIAQLQFPRASTAESQSALDAAAILFDRLITIPRGGRPLTSFQTQFGFTRGDFYCTHTITGYEHRTLEVSVAPGGPKIQQHDHPSEFGFQVTQDVNNKPAATHGSPTSDLEAVLAEHEAAYQSLAVDLNLEGLL